MSDDETEMVQVAHNVPKEYRDRAQRNTEYGEMSERVRGLFEQHAYPDDVTDRDDIDQRLRELRAERDERRIELRRVTGELETEIDALETKITRLEERKDTAASKSDQFEGALDQLTAHVQSGGYIWESYPGVERAAKTVDESPEYVIERVKERAPDVPEDQFSEGAIHGGSR